MNLPMRRRPDTSLALIHLTGDRAGVSALEALVRILNELCIRGSGNTGFIKGTMKAACLSEMPLSAVPMLIERALASKHPYGSYGVAISKHNAFSKGVRPVIYLPDAESSWIPDDQRWRQVRFEYGKVDFSHEREWRCQGNLSLEGTGFYAIVKSVACEQAIRPRLSANAARHILGFLHLDILSEFL